jgi:RND superfamily putative drug exporter
VTENSKNGHTALEERAAVLAHMEGLSRFVLRHKLAVTLTWLALAVAGVLATSQIGGRLTAQNSMPGRPSYETNAAIAKTYGTGGRGDPLVPVITLPAGQTVDSPGVRAGIGRAFAAAATAVHGRAVSYADTGDRRLVGRDARTTFGFVYAPARQSGGMHAPDLTAPVTVAMRAALPPGATMHVTGMEPLQSGGGSGRGVSVLSETLVGGLGALAVLAFVFGSLLAVVPLLIAACSIVTSFLVVYGLTTVTDVSVIVQFIIALIGLGVAIDYSLLLVTRWREEQASGYEGDEAVRRAMTTAGRAIVFSGGAVAIGLVAMVVLPVPFLRSVGYGGIIIPVVSVVAVLTLLPVLLARFGPRIDRPRLRKSGGAGRGWSAWARGVVRFRWAAVAASGAFLAALAVAALGLHLGDPESDALASSGPAYEGRAALVHSGVPTGVLTPIDVLVPRGGDPAATAATLARLPGVVTAVAPDNSAWRRGGTALITVVPAAEGGSAAGKEMVRRVRATVPAGVGVAGSAAVGVDFAEAVYGAFPLMLTLIAVATFVLLAQAFRSLLLPLKAVLLNLVSLAAILGAMVLVWQDGYGSKPIWGITATGSITEFVPVMVFAFLYGLSMDYEVFILARMREEYDRTGSTRTAVVEGIGRTGRLVTSAALILFLAFASLASAPMTDLKVFATGLGLGVLLDATVIRALLVPALVSLFGRWNWWLPGWAARVLRVRPAPLSPEPAPEPVPVGTP